MLPGYVRRSSVGLAVVLGFVVVSGGALAPVVPRQIPVQTLATMALSIGFLTPVDSLNPFRGLNNPSFVLYGLLYDYLFSLDQDGNPVPNLAVGATVAANGTQWTYQIRPGVTWSDGTALTASDVAFTINYASQNLGRLWAYEPYMNQVVQCTPSNAGACGAVVTSPGNVTVFFQRPFASGKALYVPILEQAQWSAVSPSAAQTSYANPTPIGTGPFIADPNIYNEFLSEYAQPIHVTRNPQYHPVGAHVGAANLTDIYIWVYADPASLAVALESGVIQLAEMTPSSIGAVRGQPNILTQAALQSTQYWNEIGISQIDTSTADGKLNPARWDVNVRRAMAQATNKDYIVKQFYAGQGVPGTSLMSPLTPYWFDPVATGDNLTFDIGQANAVLNRSGYTTWSGGAFGNGYRMATNAIAVSFQTACFQCASPANVTKTIPAGTALTFTIAVRPPSVFPQELATAQYLQTQYAQIGISLTIKIETTESALSTDVYGGNVEMYIWFWSSDPDPNYIMSMESSWTLDGWNDNYWNNATYNHDYLAQLADFNRSVRIVDVRAAQKINYESAPYIVYVYPYGEWAMRTDAFSNWGDWSVHPYRQMLSFWGANPLYLELGSAQVNHPPSTPVIQGTPPIVTSPGQAVTFTGSSTDPDPGETLTWTWAWGDGTQTVLATTSATSSVSASHAWATPGAFTVLLTVSDGQLSATSSGFAVDVLGVSVSSAYGRPGQSLTLSGAIVETSKGRWSFSFGDGSTASGTFAAGATSLSFPHVYAVAGTYTATLTAKTGSTTQSGTGRFIIDGTPPTVTTPSSFVVPATGVLTTVNFTVTATDNVGIASGPTCSPQSGTGFPLGPTLVVCGAIDLSGNVGYGNFTVTVRDLTPPTVVTPGPIFPEATSASGAFVTFNVSATDDVAVASGPTCTPASGSLFPLGPTLVVCTATDTSGNVGYGNFTVTVVDTIAPFTNITLAKDGNGFVVYPGGVTPSTTMTFQFVAYDAVGVVGYLCAIYTLNTSAPCSSPVTYTGLSYGIHTFSVAGVDAAGNLQFANFTWTILSPSATVQDLVAKVSALQAAGKLSAKQAGVLLTPLNRAYTELQAGKIGAAIKDLKSFRSLVTQDVGSGVLSPIDAQPLLDESADLILVLGGTP